MSELKGANPSKIKCDISIPHQGSMIVDENQIKEVINEYLTENLSLDVDEDDDSISINLRLKDELISWVTLSKD